MTKRYFAQGVQDGNTAYFYTRDHLGSVRELTDSSGALHARYDYDPWGRRTKLSGDKDADIGFTGHFEHASSELTLSLYRAYGSNLGRWLSDDPLGLAAGFNLGQYVGNDPVGSFDPLGLQNLTNGTKQPIRIKDEQGDNRYQWLEPGKTLPGDGVVVGDIVVKTTDHVNMTVTIDKDGKVVATPTGILDSALDPVSNAFQRITGRETSGVKGDYHDWTKPGRHPDWADPQHGSYCPSGRK